MIKSVKTKLYFAALTLVLLCNAASGHGSPSICGSYLEVRSCDVYTGPCFANAEMGLSGKEGMLVWSIKSGGWEGTNLDGLKVIAIVRTDGTLGNVRFQPRQGKAVLIVDAKGTAAQRKALTSFAKSMAGGLIHDVVSVKTLPIEAELAVCDKSGCARVQAGDLVEISTRCMSDKDHICGNEELFYPPLTLISQSLPALTELAAFRGEGLGLTWETTHARSAYLGMF